MGPGNLGLEDLGRGDAETRGRGDSGTGRLGEAGRRGGGEARRRGGGEVGEGGDAVNKKEFFGALDLYAGKFVSRLSRLVADDFQRSWFGLISLLANFTVKALGT